MSGLFCSAMTLTSLGIPAAHDPVDELLPVQHLWFAHDFKSGEAPIDTIHTEMGGEVVCERVSLAVECLDEGDMLGDHEVERLLWLL